MNRLTLITGGARSGKSGYAQQLAEQYGGPRVFLATSRADDPEMAARIDRHQREREGRNWRTVEEPLDPARALAGIEPEALVLIDCLTLWIANLMQRAHEQGHDLDESGIIREAERLLAAARNRLGPVIMVSNEVGLGIVPDNPLARRYRDLVGRCNQVVAAGADQVFLVSCGLALPLSGDRGQGTGDRGQKTEDR